MLFLFAAGRWGPGFFCFTVSFGFAGIVFYLLFSPARFKSGRLHQFLTERWCGMARPLKYKTVAELESAIDAYFEDCKGKPLLDENGQPVLTKFGDPVILDAHPPTVTGLALALGFTSRQALLNYQAKKQFVDTITRAKARCEAYAESRLFDRDGARGAQFSLEHNFRWRTDNDPAADQLDKAAQLLGGVDSVIE